MTYAFWMKCDFQVHTCRDPNWVGPRPIGMGEKMADGADVSAADVDAARLSWAKEFLTLCVAKGLRAVAITDHHETVMIPYLRQAFSEHNSANPAASVWLFPGMELTASGGKQCIVLFDSDITEEWLTQAQGKLGIVF